MGNESSKKKDMMKPDVAYNSLVPDVHVDLDAQVSNDIYLELNDHVKGK
jgi:hypothetical protein